MKYLRTSYALWYADNYKTLTETEEQNKCKRVYYVYV